MEQSPVGLVLEDFINESASVHQHFLLSEVCTETCGSILTAILLFGPFFLFLWQFVVVFLSRHRLHRIFLYPLLMISVDFHRNR